MKQYLITDPLYYTTNPTTFAHELKRNLLQYKPDFACFRDKSFGDKQSLFDVFLRVARECHTIPFVNSMTYLPATPVCGVHIASCHLSKIRELKRQGFQLCASCHNAEQMTQALGDGSDYITLSPLFSTPHKGEPLGIERFRELLSLVDASRVFALGGINSPDAVRLVSTLGLFGFASIRYFVVNND